MHIQVFCGIYKIKYNTNLASFTTVDNHGEQKQQTSYTDD